MPCFQLSYLGAGAARELIDADDADEAAELAKMRLLFHEPGFAIAVLFEGGELARVTQQPKRTGSHFVKEEGWLAQ